MKDYELLMKKAEKFFLEAVENDEKLTRLKEKKEFRETAKYDGKIEELQEEIRQNYADFERALNQAKNCAQMRNARLKEAERKARTHRLIQVGAAFEKGSGLEFEGEEDLLKLIDFLQDYHFKEAYQRWVHEEC